MKYDEARMKDAIVYSGVPKETLDDYVERTSDAVKYYDFDSFKAKYNYDKPENVLEISVLRSKYLAPTEDGPLYMWDRIARALSSVEKPENQEHWYKEFMSVLRDFKFVPGGRVMHGAGREDVKRHPTLSNCYVIPIEEDSLEGIYKCITESAMVYRTGGGVGTDLSILRPEGSFVNSTVDRSPGATAFMNLFSESTNTVSQSGRRGALMLTLLVDHPDVEKFITIKNDSKRTKVQHANVSVLLTHEFRNAVINEQDFDLRWGGKTYKTVKAKDLWYKIITNAYASAEPGLIFWDTMKDYHNLEYANPLSSTNPCGEQPLAAYTACNLGNINLSALVDENGKLELNKLEKVVRTSTRFMDNIIDYNIDNHASERIKKAVSSDRRIGLGVTGLGDMFVKMGIRYDSEEALKVADQVFKVIRDVAYKTSIEIAKEKGQFPLFNWNGYSKSKFVQSLPQDIQNEIKEHGIRNGTVLTLPPVGTGSIVSETSSGIEPIFCTSYERDVKQHDKNETKTFHTVHPLIRKMFKDENNLPDYVVTAHIINPNFRVKMQGVIQKYIDSSISSTINLPEDISVKTVADIYMDAYKNGLKGVTVYREGSRDGVLRTEEFASKKEGSLETKVNGFIHPRKRPKRTLGYTERIKTSKGNMYVHFGEDDKGLCEVFAAVGKAGGEGAAQAEATSRLISIGLRAGIDPLDIVEELKNISGPELVFDGDRRIYSIPDGIGQLIEDYIIEKGNSNGKAVKKQDPKPEDSSQKNKRITDPCPECGVQLSFEQSCMKCGSCGWSKC